jgi:histidine triad (HIT) family protein
MPTMEDNLCAFCEIVEGARPATGVFESDLIVAFLDARPLFPGHTLVVPRPHHETLADLPPELVGPTFEVVRRLVAVMPDALEADGTFVAINNRVSQSVPHLHVHVVPRKRGDGLKGFFWPRARYGTPEEAEAVAARLRNALAATPHH